MNDVLVKMGGHAAVANNSKSKSLTTNRYFYLFSQEVSAHFTVTWVLRLTKFPLLSELKLQGMPWLGERA